MSPAGGARYAHPQTSAWTPASLSPFLWYDASNTGSLTVGGGRCSQINDLSGAGAHATQANGSYQPTSGSLTINGLNCLGYNHGRGDTMETGSVLTQTQPFTALAVFRCDSTSYQARVFDTASGGRVLLNAGFGYGPYAGGFFEYGSIDTNAHQQVGVFNGGSSEVFLDGTSLGTGNCGSNQFGASGILTLGGYTDHSGTMEGAWGELVLVAGVISSGDRTSWNTYCARWGL